MEKAVKIVAAILVLVLLVAAFLFFWHFTAGFAQNLSTFYVSEGKKDILTASTGNNFYRKYVFEVHYMFGAFMDDTSWSYKLACTKDFTFYIDGEKYLFSQVDLKKLLDVKKDESTLTIDFSDSIYTLLAGYYGVDASSIKIDASAKRADVVTLTFYSSDDEHAVKVSGLFGGLDKIFQTPTGLKIDPSEVIF